MTTALATVGTQLAFDPQSPEFRATASHMAKEYREGLEQIRQGIAAVRAASDRVFHAFEEELTEESSLRSPSNPFHLSITYDHNRGSLSDFERIADGFKRNAWRLMVNKLGVKNLMSIKQRAEYEKQLESGELPDIHEDAIIGMILGLGNRLEHFATAAAKEVFDWLRPQRGYGLEYKTNNAFKVGRRVILGYMVDRSYGGGFRVNYSKDQHVLALESVFRLMDGKGPMQNRRSELEESINGTKEGSGETEYFRWKAFKNGNLHLEFKRLDLVKQLNGLATGSFELGKDADQVA